MVEHLSIKNQASTPKKPAFLLAFLNYE